MRLKIFVLTFFYNDHLSATYVADILMDPMLWFVDNFTQLLGPFFIGAVICLTISVAAICFWIGLPYWWQRDVPTTIALLVVGHWILFNVIFHYYMGCYVSPGLPPEGVFIPEAVSICKKCIAPKPPRTHHCSVCNKCILKMDHHCRILLSSCIFIKDIFFLNIILAWLNNCVGFYNHRHFFLYMAYTTFGVSFIITFGIELFFERIWWAEEELEGHPIRLNNSILVDVTEPPTDNSKVGERRAIIYMAFICVGIYFSISFLRSQTF